MSKIGIFNENAEFFEEFCNSQEDTAFDRFGRERKTIEGIDSNLISTINDKIIAQGGIEILQDRGDRIDATMSQKWDTQTTVGAGDIVRESAVPVVVSETGESTVDAISQKAFTDLSFGIEYTYSDITSQIESSVWYTATKSILIIVKNVQSGGNNPSGGVFRVKINDESVVLLNNQSPATSFSYFVPSGYEYSFGLSNPVSQSVIICH